MSIVDDLRRRTLRIIEADPVQVTITRRVKVSRPAGGIGTQEVTLGPQTVRLYAYARRGAPANVVQPGAVGPIRVWGLVAGHTADVAPGDEFEARGRKFRVLTTRQETFRGEAVSISADVEEVGPDAGV